MTTNIDVTTGILTKNFVSLLKLYSVLHWRVSLGGVQRAGKARAKNPMAGMPDFAGLTRNGRAWFAEIKGPGDKLSEKQLFWIAQLSANYALTAVIKSEEGSKKFIEQILSN